MKATCQYFCRTVLFNASALVSERELFNESLVSLSLIESNFVMNRLGMICKCIGHSLSS